jgi:modification methylase
MIVLLNGDHKDFTPQLPAEQFDLLLVDPPYNLGARQDISIPGRSDIKRSFGEWDQFSGEQEFVSYTSEWLAAMRLLLKPGASSYVFCTAEYAGDIKRAHEALGFTHKATITWHKTNPPPHFRKRNFISSCESIVFSVLDASNFEFKWQGQAAMHNFVEGPLCMGDERIKQGGVTLHPTQKPEWLIRHIMNISGVSGGWVLDPFMGTGTVPHVAREYGMNAVGIEIDPRYYRAAVERVDTSSFDADDEVLLEVPKSWTSMSS